MNEQLKYYDSADHWIYSETKGIVQSGPFAGMKMLDEKGGWDDGNLKTKCLGCYEEELHPIIEYEIERLIKLENPRIVDLGCAEGYYSIGLARRLSKATIYGVDVSDKCLELARKAAELNGVEIKFGAVISDVMNKPDLVICDVEGHEADYLNLNYFPNLAHADIIVECHDCGEINNHFTKILTERFSLTHNVECIFEGARNPNKYGILQKAESLHRWMAVCEGRPCLMNWLVMIPK